MTYALFAMRHLLCFVFFFFWFCDSWFRYIETSSKVKWDVFWHELQRLSNQPYWRLHAQYQHHGLFVGSTFQILPPYALCSTTSDVSGERRLGAAANFNICCVSKRFRYRRMFNSRIQTRYDSFGFPSRDITYLTKGAGISLFNLLSQSSDMYMRTEGVK